MKKVLSLFTAVIVVLCTVFCVNAAATPYEIPEMDMTISFYSMYDIITQDTPENAYVFAKYGLDGAATIAALKASNIYLNALYNGTATEEIVVTMAPNNIEKFDGMSDTALMVLASSFVEGTAAYGMEITDYDIYHHSQVPFIRIRHYAKANDAYSVQYYTIYNNQAINITLRSYGSPVTAAQELRLQTVVDSATLHNYVAETQPAEKKPSISYTDTDTGVTFTVPKNWKSEDMSTERQYLDAKFVSVEDPGMVILYGSTDAWSELTTAERFGYTRSDFDNNMFSTIELKQMLGIDGSMDKVTIGNDEYFCFEQTSATAVGDFSFSLTMTTLIRIENGWMYMFQFSGTKDDDLYADFESTVSSVVYPQTANNDGISGWGILVTVLVVIGIIIAVAIWRKKKEDAEFMAQFAPPPAMDHPHPQSTPPAPQPDTDHYCTACGTKLPPDSAFCHNCGTKTKEIQL